jgi:hypothetical protein
MLLFIVANLTKNCLYIQHVPHVVCDWATWDDVW